MTPTLNDLITGAVQLAGGDSTANGGRLWHMEGGRSCPLGAAVTSAQTEQPSTPSAHTAPM